MKAKAYAKINLGLKLKGKREDGFHELEMLMINISLYDVLRFKKSNDIIVNTSNNVCAQEDNIVYKVAKIMQEKYNVKDGINIYIDKRIPDGGGLGGGSSDAACTIQALNKIWGLNLKLEEMECIANQVGSDVCFFLYNKISKIEGRGDIVKPIDKRLDKKVILIVPGIKCSTKKVYAESDSIMTDYSIDDIISNIDNDNYYSFLFNDLELATLKAYPEYPLEDIKKYVYNLGAKKVLMSGSGSTIFALVDNYKSYSILKKQYKDYLVLKAKTISYCKTL